MILIFLVDEFHKEARMAAWGKITTEQAGGFVLGFGKYRGRSIEQVAGTDDGLRYLDYVVGQDWCFPDTKEAIGLYLAQDHIRRELERITGD